MRFQRQKQSYKEKSYYVGLVVILIVWIAVGLGCASTHKTTTTQTTVTSPNRGVVYQRDQNTITTVTTSDSPPVEKSETTTTTTEAKAENPGILSSTLHAVGYVLVLPFIIIGGLFRIIFGG